MTGGLGGGQSEPARPDITQEPYQQVGPQQQQQQQQQQQACACELAEFVACALGDLKLCEDPERRSKGACLLMVSETRPGFV
ncbi:coiled-coil-helix-coiled-coil-helix domain-containing protein 2-like [Oreochromis aureus]|uniref:coiled-coil-helix-coiled-coil-helix domain-containing protein 2-like n=1 Tax=Oreochromis aureus TaxID=47969 RepID=UPI001952D443|nr:coiled-coil-helix-coiled-coil-helix domain-containing protein 2-like [Oreochromis aureus]